jgi:hemerythrin
MKWSEDMCVGITAIDYQHVELLNRINAFHAALHTEASKVETQKVLMFLSVYMDFHFRQEEAIQRKYHYPKANEHRQLHKDFAKTMRNLSAEIEENGITPTASSLLSMMVSNWMVSHVSVQDRDMSNYIMENYPGETYITE